MALNGFVSFLTGGVKVPDSVIPVAGFQLERYLGKWYEIARFDHAFERGLICVTADYSLRPDGGVRVLNCGYSQKESKWKQAEGKAYFVDRRVLGWVRLGARNKRGMD